LASGFFIFYSAYSLTQYIWFSGRSDPKGLREKEEER
jgi:hypothetical protein